MKENKKYFVSIKMPYGVYNLRIKILQIKKSKYCDYITFETLHSSKDLISECRYNPITIPLDWILKHQSLYNIFNNYFIFDIIYLINKYI